MANITDKFPEATSGTRPETAVLTAQKNIGAASITVDTTSGWATTTATHFIIYQVDVNGNRVANTQTEWKGIVTSGTGISSLTLKAGTDQVYPIGSKVIAAPTAAWADDVVEGIAVHANQDGTLKTNSVTTTNITDSNVTTAKIADDAVTDAKLDYPRWWQEIARTTLGTAGDTITVSSIPARKYLKILVYAAASGGTLVGTMRFNNDSGANYSQRYSDNGGADSALTSSSNMVIRPGTTVSGGSQYCEVEVINVATYSKFVRGSAVGEITGTGAGNAPSRLEGGWKWANTADQINRVDYINSGTGDFAIGSEVIILGHD